MSPKMNVKYRCKDLYMEVLARDFQGKYQVIVYEIDGHYTIRHLDAFELKALYNSRKWENV